jgi:hypothetical protein
MAAECQKDRRAEVAIVANEKMKDAAANESEFCPSFV